MWQSESTSRPAVPNRFGRSFLTGLAGGAIGAGLLLLLGLVSGLWFLMVIPPYVIILVLCVPVSALIVAGLARISPWRLSRWVLIPVAAVLAILLWAALPATLMLTGSPRDGGGLF